MSRKHLLFFDGECGFCHAAVRFVAQRDRKELFLFAPLQGATAARKLPHLSSASLDSVILMENFEQGEEEVYLGGTAVLRVCWLLGGPWALLGGLSFLPSWLYDWLYRIIARNRDRLRSKRECHPLQPEERKRFLDE